MRKSRGPFRLHVAIDVQVVRPVTSLRIRGMALAGSSSGGAGPPGEPPQQPGHGRRQRPGADAEYDEGPVSKSAKRRERRNRVTAEVEQMGREHPGWVPDPARPDRDEWRAMRDIARQHGYDVPDRPAGLQASYFVKANALSTVPRPRRATTSPKEPSAGGGLPGHGLLQPIAKARPRGSQPIPKARPRGPTAGAPQQPIGLTPAGSPQQLAGVAAMQLGGSTPVASLAGDSQRLADESDDDIEWPARWL